MLRAARLLLQRRTALGAATAPAIGPLARTQHLPLPWQRTAAPVLGLRSCLFASKAAREQGERKDDGKGKDGGASKGKRSLKQRLKETPVDPRLYQHLERLGLGADSTRRPPKGQRRRKQRVTVDMDQVEARLKKESIPYFQANRFTQAKRAVRRERRRLVREASNRLHLLNKAQVDRHEQRVKEKSWQRLMQTQQQGQRQRPQVREHRAEEDGEDGEGGSDGDGDDDRARRLSRLFRASAASGSVRFATAAFRYVDLPSPLSLVVHGNEQRGRGPRVVPEVALAGRSNVGKSTLLNALLGLQARRGAAAVGDKPGVTKSLDFYRIGSRSNPRLVVVDLPGYGFAFGKEERVEQSQQLTLAYLRHRGAPLKRLLLLLDARHGLKHQDRAFLQRLYAAPSEQEEEEEEGEEDEEEEEESDDGRRYPSVWDASDDHATRHTSNNKTGPPTPEHDDDGPHPPPTATLLPLPPFRPPKLQVVFTKCDLLPRDDLARRILLTRRELEEELGLGLLDMGLLGGRVVLPKALVAGLPSLMVAAGRGRKGLVELQAELAALLPPLPQVPAPSSSSHNHQHHQQQQPQQHQRSRSPEWPKGPQRQRQGQERRRKEARGEKGMGGSKGQQRWGGRR